MGFRKARCDQRKHEVSFAEAQYAFADPQRVIARDLEQSQLEERYYCFGMVQRGVLTVRFTYRESAIRIFGAGYWRRGRRFMSEKTRYTNEPLGKLGVIPDFLPSPKELAFREEGIKVTLALSKKSVDFFKSQAAKHHTQYQRMIRRLLDSYVESQDARKTSPSRRARVPRPRK